MMAISKLLKSNRTRKSSSGIDVPTGASDKHPISVCHTMNDHIHQQIHKLVAKNAETPFEIATPDILASPYLTHGLGDDRAPDTVSERHNISVHCLPHENAVVFLLYVLHYYTDHRCSMPLPTLLTGIVETCGESHVLVHILK